MKTQDPSEIIAIHIRNYVRGAGLLIGAVETFKRMEWYFERSFALRIISRTLTEVQFIDELRGLELHEHSRADREDEYDDDDSDFFTGEVKHSIVQAKLSRGQVLEADWEAHRIESQVPYARIDIIKNKIEQGPLQWNDVIDDISFLDDPNDRLMLLCELAEAAFKAHHADSARFFKFVHDSVKQAVVPDGWRDDPAPYNHPLAPLALLYEAANRHEDYIAFMKGVPQPDRDVLMADAIHSWLLRGTDAKRLLAYADEIERRLEKASTLCAIAHFQAAEDPNSARETLIRAEQLLNEAHDDPGQHDHEHSMVAGEIMKVKLALGDEKSVDTYLMDEEEEMVSDLLNLELDAVSKALEKGHVRKAKSLADQIIDDDQQAIAYGWIAYEHIKRAKADSAYALLAQGLSPYSRLRPIAELMWRLSQDGVHHFFYNQSGTFVSLAIKTAKEDLKDKMDDELRQHYIRVLVYAARRLVIDAKNELATSDPDERSKQLQTEFVKVLQARSQRYLPKLALLLTLDDRKLILENCIQNEERRMAEAAMLACEL